MRQTYIASSGRGSRSGFTMGVLSRLGRDQRGAMFAEYLISYPVLLITFLGFVQVLLAHRAKLAVEAAAREVADAATRILDEDPALFAGACRRDLLAPGPAAGEDRLGALLDAVGAEGRLGPPTSYRGNARLSALRQVAQAKLLAVSPPFARLADRTLMKAVGLQAAGGSLKEAARYARAAVAVTFPRSEGGMDYKWRYEPDETFRVRVTFLFYCAVPVVDWFICRPHPARSEVPGTVGALGAAQILRKGAVRLERAAQDLLWVEDPGLAAAFGRARFLVLSAEATGSVQAAEYDYESGGGC